MKNIEVTYDALICENGTYEQGEAAFILPMTDELAAEYLAGRATDRGAVNLVETALEAVEVMRGRVSLTENSKSRFTITQGVNDGVPVSNSAVVQSPDGDVMARLMCGNVLGAPQAKLEFLYKVDNILWTVMNLTYDGSKNRVTLYAGKNAELYIQGKKF